MTGLEIGLLGVIFAGSCYLSFVYGINKGAQLMKQAVIAQFEELDRKRKIVQMSGHRNNNKGGLN